MTVGAVLSDATSLMCQEGKRPQDPEGANFIPIRYVKRVTFEPSARYIISRWKFSRLDRSDVLRGKMSSLRAREISRY